MAAEHTDSMATGSSNRISRSAIGGGSSRRSRQHEQAEERTSHDMASAAMGAPERAPLRGLLERRADADGGHRDDDEDQCADAEIGRRRRPRQDDRAARQP